MRLHQASSIAIGTTILLLTAPTVCAAATVVTAIRLNSTSSGGIELTLNIQGSSRPTIATAELSNTLLVNISDTQLRLPQGKSFWRNNPAFAIASVQVNQPSTNSIQLIVTGADRPLVSTIVRQDAEAITLRFNPNSSNAPAPTPTPKITAPEASTSAQATPTTSARASITPRTLAVPATLMPPPATPTPTLRTQGSGPSTRAISSSAPANPIPPRPSAPASFINSGPLLITPPTVVPPKPPATSTVPLLPRAVAPPVGDIVLSNIDVSPPEAPNTRLMRTLRLNQIEATLEAVVIRRLSSLAETGGTVSGSGTSGDSFNKPTSSTASTSLRRNTITTENVRYRGGKEFLEAFGANGGGTNTGTSVSSQTSSSGSQALSENQSQSERQTITESQELGQQAQGQTQKASSNLLQGLEVVADARSNSLTLLGPPRLVEIATLQLMQLDVRQRQVAVNVKIVDVDLIQGRNANADLQYRVNDTIGLRFGPDPNNANRVGLSTIIGRTATGAAAAATGVGAVGAIAQNFLATLFAAVQNQSAKILTNPTLIVQEGSSAQVNLTQEIFSGFEVAPSTRDVNGDLVLGARKPIIKPAGVIVNVTVDQIDDNGFVTLNISPEVSAPSGEVFEDQGSQARLLLQRRLETGRVRLRDGQTLILTGIIQDQDRLNVSKIPILGDIPLLGRLFRRVDKTSERREVVVLVTPQLLDDSDSGPKNAPYGYRYTPSPEAQKLLKP